MFGLRHIHVHGESEGTRDPERSFELDRRLAALELAKEAHAYTGSQGNVFLAESEALALLSDACAEVRCVVDLCHCPVREDIARSARRVKESSRTGSLDDGRLKALARKVDLWLQRPAAVLYRGERMSERRNALEALALNRDRRRQADGRFDVPLTDAEISSSTRMAMRLADASASAAEASTTSLPATA